MSLGKPLRNCSEITCEQFLRAKPSIWTACTEKTAYCSASPDGKIILLTTKKITIDTPPVSTVVIIL